MGVFDFLSRKDKLAGLPVKAEDIRGAAVKVVEVGSTGTEIYAGYLQEEYLDDLRGKEAADIFDRMRRSDPKVRMITSAMKNPIKSASWEIQIEEGFEEDEGAKKQKELLTHILFKDLGGKTWRSFLHEALSMIDFGYSVFEKTYRPVLADPKFGSYNGIKSLAFRSQRTIERWNLDQAGKLNSVSQFAYGDAQKVVDIPAPFLLHFAIEQEGSNFEGISILRPCYGPWMRKNNFLKVIAIGIERHAIGIADLEIPDGEENGAQIKKAKAWLQAYVTGRAAYILRPKGWEFKITTNPFDAEKVRRIVNEENVEMVNAALANFLELGQSGSGSYSLSFDLSDFFLGGLEYIADQICETMNGQLITDLVRMNFADRCKVKLVCSGITDRAGEELSKVIMNLTNSGVLKGDDRLEASLRKRFGLPEAEASTARVAPTATPGASPSLIPQDQTTKTELSLNGAQVTSMVEVVTKFKEGILDKASAIQILTTAFPISDDQAAKIVGEPLPPKKEILDLENPQSGKSLALAEAVPAEGDPVVTVIDKGTENLKKVYSEGLTKIAEEMKATVLAQWEKGGAEKFETPDLTKMVSNTYAAKVANALTEIYNEGSSQVQTEIKGGKVIKLAEDPKRIAAARLKADVSNLTDVQIADLAKTIALTYGQNLEAAATAEELATILDEAIAKFIDGPVSKVGAEIASSKTVNDSRKDFFAENTEEIISFTWVNGDPVSEICQWLDGRTIPAGHPDVDRYWPPLHHNCKTYVIANTRETTGNPEPQDGFSPPETALGSITLQEGTNAYGISCCHR